MNSPSPAPPFRQGGVHLSRGVSLRIPAGGLSISVDEQGNPRGELREVHLRLDTSIEWLEIALEHLDSCRTANEKLGSATTDAELAAPLQRVFKSSMQAIVAAATFFEALYAATRDYLPPNRIVAIPSGRPNAAREAYVTEQLKQAFGLRKIATERLRTVLAETYRFRDETVHPAASFGPPVRHPQLGLLVERRFAMFTYPNSQLLVRAALAYCRILATIGRANGPKQIQDLVKYMQETGQPLFDEWQRKYGPLLDEAAA